LRLTQDEVEQHPAWRYAESAGKHPPLRGLLAVPIVGEDGLNYGLLQPSDKSDGGDFDEDDERRLQCVAAPPQRWDSMRCGRCWRSALAKRLPPRSSRRSQPSWWSRAPSRR
jgi:hypothetical protein